MLNLVNIAYKPVKLGNQCWSFTNMFLPHLLHSTYLCTQYVLEHMTKGRMYDVPSSNLSSHLLIVGRS